MNLKENSVENLVLTDTPWWMPVTGLIVASFCFWFAATQMAEYPELHRLGTWIAGLVFLGVTTLAARKTTIHFDHAAQTVTRTTGPLLPLGTIYLFRPRSESRPIDSIRYAFLERQLKQNGNTNNNPQNDVFCLALATGDVPEEVLMAKHAFVQGLELDKVRWLVGYNASMKRNAASKILTAVNQWLGTTSPQQLKEM